MIEHVEHIHSELQRGVFPKSGILHDRQVHLCEPGPAQEISRRIPRRKGLGRAGESGSVKLTFRNAVLRTQCSRRGVWVDTRNQIRTERKPAEHAALPGHVDRQAGAELRDRVDLPAVCDPPRKTIAEPAARRRDLVARIEDKVVTNVLVTTCPFASGVELVLVVLKETDDIVDRVRPGVIEVKPHALRKIAFEIGLQRIILGRGITADKENIAELRQWPEKYAEEAEPKRIVVFRFMLRGLTTPSVSRCVTWLPT